MKLLVLFCALAAVALSAPATETVGLHFSFLNTDGVSASQSLTLPFNYAGSVNISVANPPTDLMLCIHWVVPAVAPYGENLDLGKIWEVTCTSYQSVSADEPFAQSDVILRSGEYFVTAAVPLEDIDSNGIVDTADFDFTATFAYLECDEDKFGDSCIHDFSYLSFDAATALTVGQDPQYYALPTQDEQDTATAELFASSLIFSFDAAMAGGALPDGTEFTLSYRMMGSPEDNNDGTECRSSSECSIENPPFTATPGFLWGISLHANQEVDITLTISLKYCEHGSIGADCEEYVTLTTDVGVVKKYSKKTTLVFDSSVSVAVGGLDGYEQQKIAPDVMVQVDAEPFAKSSYNLLLSSGAQANVAIIDMSDSPDSKIVLTINPSKSFGIWKVDDTTQCPDDCADHGTCSSEEYVCKCNDKYEDLDCGHEIKDFTIEYIILIAVGAILILAIVIGVPVYCYKNRNQDYDIVA